MAAGERPLDPRLAGEQPVERTIELVLARVGDIEDRPERALPKRAGGGELGAGGDEAGHDHGQREIAAPRRSPIEERLQPERAQYPQHRGHVAMGGAAHDPKGRRRGHQVLPPQRALDRVDDRWWQRGQRGEGPVLDRAALPIRLAQQHRGVFATALHVSYSGHVHCPTRPPRHAHIIAHMAPLSSTTLATS
jgi:hypothetical protein